MDFGLHLEAMAWLRYGKQMAYVATEAGFYNADVLGSDGEKLIEIEIKKTASDFANDFRTKPWKHMAYAQRPQLGSLAWVPNQFYFFVNTKFEAQALKILEEQKSPAGLLVLQRPMTGVYGYAHRRHTVVVKRAVTIHKAPVGEKVLTKLAKRMSSDLVTSKLMLDNLGRNKIVAPDVILQLTDAFRVLTKTPDWEMCDEKKLEQGETQPGDHQGPDGDSGRPGAVRDDGAKVPEVLPPSDHR